MVASGQLAQAWVENTAWAVLGAWLIDHAARGVGGAVGQVLSFRPLVYLGRISYGVYLIHLFVPTLLYQVTSPAGLLIRLAIRGFSWSSAQSPSPWRRWWHWYEAPINRLKRRFPYTA